MNSTEATKNLVLDALDITQFGLHSGAPGAAGTANEVSGSGYARQAGTLAAASGGERAVSAQIDFSTPASQSVTHISLWAGSTFRLSIPRTSGDSAANSAGEYSIGTGTKVTIQDVA